VRPRTDLCALGALLIDDGSRPRMGATNSELVAEHAFENTLDTFEGIFQPVLA